MPYHTTIWEWLLRIVSYNHMVVDTEYSIIQYGVITEYFIIRLHGGGYRGVMAAEYCMIQPKKGGY